VHVKDAIWTEQNVTL